MSVVETVLVFVGIPLGIVLLVALLTLVPGRVKKARYKPGQPWEHPPVWYAPHPDHGPAAGNHDADPKAIGSSVYQEPQAIGAGHGSSGDGAAGHGAAAARAPRGPLGGARGTW